MANFFAPITCLALLGGSLFYGETQLEATRAQKAALEINDQSTNTWLLSNDITHDICLITKTRQVTASTARLSVDSTCDGVIAASQYITVWQEDENGNVTLADDQGNTITEFSFHEDLGLTSQKGSPEKLSLTPSA